jgi:CheY-like chemotaxis protein
MYQIAVVDDNESWCFVLATRLKQHGYCVSTFTDTDLFLREAKQFDLALIDFSMPPRRYQVDTDGPDIIRKLKQRLDHPPLVILISSFFTEDILNQVADLGLQADAYLSKTVDSTQLLQQIEDLLATRRSRSQADINDGKITKPQSSSSHSAGIDHSLQSKSRLDKFSRSH